MCEKEIHSEIWMKHFLKNYELAQFLMTTKANYVKT